MDLEKERMALHVSESCVRVVQPAPPLGLEEVENSGIEISFAYSSERASLIR